MCGSMELPLGYAEASENIPRSLLQKQFSLSGGIKEPGGGTWKNGQILLKTREPPRFQAPEGGSGPF